MNWAKTSPFLGTRAWRRRIQGVGGLNVATPAAAGVHWARDAGLRRNNFFLGLFPSVQILLAPAVIHGLSELHEKIVHGAEGRAGCGGGEQANVWQKYGGAASINTGIRGWKEKESAGAGAGCGIFLRGVARHYVSIDPRRRRGLFWLPSKCLKLNYCMCAYMTP